MLDRDLCADIVQISCRKKGMISEFEEGFVCFGMLSVLEIPSRRFRAEIDETSKRNSWDKC